MNFIFHYLMAPFLNWGYYIVSIAVIFAAACKSFAPMPENQMGSIRWPGFLSHISYKFLIWIIVAFRILYASVETIGQYYVWSSSEFTRFFLDSRGMDQVIFKQLYGKLFPFFNNRFAYLVFYSWGRFWMSVAVSLLIAFVFYLFLVFLKKYKERFFEEGEVQLGFLMALAVGWPNFVIFLPAAFAAVVLVSICRAIIFKEAYTTLGAPLLLSALIAVLFGGYLINLLHLAAFRIM